MEYDFQTFKERIVREVPYLAKITSLSATPLHITMNDEINEVDISPVYFAFQLKEILSKGKTSPYKNLLLDRHQFRGSGLISVKST